MLPLGYAAAAASLSCAGSQAYMSIQLVKLVIPAMQQVAKGGYRSQEMTVSSCPLCSLLEIC
jgi:hypothetical protein